MSEETIDTIRAERDRLRAELDAQVAALTPHPFSNQVTTPAMAATEQEKKAARVRAAMAEGQEREAKAIAEREAAVLEAGRQRLADYEGQAHQRFLNSGGSESDWRSAWPTMKAAWLIEQAAVDPKERLIQEKVERLRRDPSYARF